MPTISNVTLSVITGGATPIISVIYLISPIGHDREHGDSFFETVELFGEDSLADGEDGTNERIRILFFDRINMKDTPIHRSHRFPVAASVLNEDPEPLQADELRVRVSLAPVPVAPPVRISNLVRLNEPVIQP